MPAHFPSPYVLAASLAFGLGACNQPAPTPEAPPAPDIAALTATIQGMEDAYAAAAAAKNVDGVMTYYSDDVVSYGMHREPITGNASLRQDMADKMAKDTLGTKPAYKVVELFAGNDHITEVGTWTDTDSAGTVVDHGTYFAVFRRNGDGWQCMREISVSAKPKEEARTAAAQP